MLSPARRTQLDRKDEQLNITTHMLRKAEETIEDQDCTIRDMKRDLASTRDSLGKVMRRDVMAG